jgi:hypothetical protein
MGSKLGRGEIFHLSLFVSYVLEMKLAAYLCRLEAEMSSKEYFGL